MKKLMLCIAALVMILNVSSANAGASPEAWKRLSCSVIDVLFGRKDLMPPTMPEFRSHREVMVVRESVMPDVGTPHRRGFLAILDGMKEVLPLVEGYRSEDGERIGIVGL